MKKISTQEIIGQLRERNAARTICYTQAACTELSTIGFESPTHLLSFTFIFSFRGKAFPAGGFTFRSRYSPNTKLCQLKIEGMRTTSPDCGNGCEYTQLQYLQPEDVARMAATPRGAVFKVIVTSFHSRLTSWLSRFQIAMFVLHTATRIRQFHLAGFVTFFF